MRGEYAERIRQELKTRCLHLHTKAAFMPLPQDDDEGNPYPTAIWWCGRTCQALGPDGSAAVRDACHRPGRSCYAGPTA